MEGLQARKAHYIWTASIDGGDVCKWDESMQSKADRIMRDLAAAAGVSAPFISETESGKKDGSVSVMKKIAEALNVDLDDVVKAATA